MRPRWAVAGRAKASVSTGPDHSQGNASTQGRYDRPQPESTADRNDSGANAGTCGTSSGGPYRSTRDGSASANGLGDGEVTGKPAAGTVGRADNKNPRGQLPGPEDGNRGYECDLPGDRPNQGIAEGNPAHSACVTPPVVTPPVVTLPATGAEDHLLAVAAGLGMTMLGLAVLGRRRLQAATRRR